MPNYWGKQIFTHGSGSKAKDGEEERERLNDGNNNGARRNAWRTQAAWANFKQAETGITNGYVIPYWRYVFFKFWEIKLRLMN